MINNKQILIVLLLLVSLFSVDAIPARNALSKRNNNNDDGTDIGTAEFRNDPNGFEGTFTFVQIDGDHDSDDDQKVFVTSLIVLNQSLRVVIQDCCEGGKVGLRIANRSQIPHFAKKDRLLIEIKLEGF